LGKLNFIKIKIENMKKFVLLIAAVSISLGAMAQMGKVTSAQGYITQGALDKAKEAIDVALTNEKSMNNPKTFKVKGDLCKAVFESTDANFKTLYANPLVEAYAAYEKALELDPKGGMKKTMSLDNSYFLLGNAFVNQAITKYEEKDYEGALKSFQNTIKLSESDVYVGLLDSSILFNAGLAAYNGKIYKEAIDLFKRCNATNYEGTTPYILTYQSYVFMNDNVNAEATLKSTFEKFPNDTEVILQLVDYYLKNNKQAEALSYINVAKAKEPNNYSLFWAEGVLYMQQEKYDDAITNLEKSIALNSTIFDTQFNTGVCYYNKASAMVLAANNIMDVNQYNEAVKVAREVFLKAIPYFQKALELKVDDIDTLKSLKELYYRLTMTDKYNETVAKIKVLEGS
jgi:tetratricopeptide (TPR) repeat protein